MALSAGGAARLRLDVETTIRAADVDGVVAAAEDAGVSVAARTASAARKKRAESGRFGGGDWTSDACAGAGATALRCVLYKRVSPIARFQHLIASPFN
ncbi:uncharacterized protein MICPUCDRAFT_52375 [Micromonas pusilla CCMP1545]|jgi:hypothetical protein|uniref:Predicted protein n=1 Tax=Micromonas pusilla (strain CCMP1545) TaxID=564608 RepID=C1N417_MICPC|nr:uncharacterized protein MICPUCDRAFT_52375 [Micromonas pusilla CCMP1545]EEH53286.1 predicted protein [Micromonas pusilla CCMP1545]|eukprot:XP_003062467.1 predicted protein [Micromonas pusilla CCMP1545]